MNVFLLRTLPTLALVLAASLSQGAVSLPRAMPESQGASSSELIEFVRALDQMDGMHSVMVARHGHVIAEGWWAPYAAAHNHVLYSLSKSFTSTAVGLAVGEGRLGIDDEVLKFFPDAAPTNASNNLKAMRVRDLLMMSTGHQDEPPVGPEAISAASFLAQAVPHLPGTHFKYNTPATFMQSAIVQKVTGQTVLDYLRPRLFEPLGIEHPVWDTNFQGVSLGGYGLRVRTEDLVKFGQLYLQHGQWNGKTLLSSQWVAMASAKQTSNGSNPKSDWNQGYGFQFWRCRNNAYRGDGAFGQYCVVLPDQDAVVAITSGIKDMQSVLNVIWDKLLPAMEVKMLKVNSGIQEQLKSTLARLQVRPAQGAPTPVASGRLLNRDFEFPANDQKFERLKLVSTDGGKTLEFSARLNAKDVNIPCGQGEWRKGRSPLFGGRLAQFPDEPMAGSFAWPSEDVCRIVVCGYETPYQLTFTLKFDGDQLRMSSEANVGFGPTKQPELVGRNAAR